MALCECKRVNCNCCDGTKRFKGNMADFGGELKPNEKFLDEVGKQLIKGGVHAISYEIGTSGEAIELITSEGLTVTISKGGL